MKCPERPFWQPRYYDFNVYSERKRIEKLKYMHRNPVKRGLSVDPSEWVWSSFRYWAGGEKGIVEIDSDWPASRLEFSIAEAHVSKARHGAPAPVGE